MKDPLKRHLLPTIRSRLLAMLVGCVLMPLIGGQLVMHFVTRRSLEASATEKYQTLVQQVARQAGALMVTAEQNLKMLSENGILLRDEFNDKDMMEEIDRLVKQPGSPFTDISIFTTKDGRGSLRYSNPKDVTDRLEITTWFKRATEGETVLSPPQMALEHKALVVGVYVPLHQRSNGRPLVARGRVLFEPVSKLLREVNMGDGGYMVLLDGMGNILAHPDREKRLQTYVGPGDTAAEPIQHAMGRDGNGQEVLWIAQQIPPAQTLVGETWTVLAIIPKKNVIAFAWESAIIHLTAGLFTLVSVAGLGYWFARRITQPLISAAQAAKRLASGDTNCRISEDSGTEEIRQLASAFNSMVKEVIHHRGGLERLVAERTQGLQEQQEKAAALSAQLRAAFEATEEAVLILRSDGRILGANRQFGQFFGVNAELLRGTLFAQWKQAFFGCFADPVGFSRCWDQGSLEAAQSPSQNWQVATPSRRILDVYAAPLTAENNDVVGKLWVFRDLTHELELQESLEQAQKMEAIGRLAGGVAHDFNNLLTGIIGNLSLADGHLERPGMEGSRHHVHYARSAAERAAQLVKGLLGFSRRSHLELTHCDLNEVVRNFHPLIERVIDPRTTMCIDLADGLWGVHADVGKLEQVLMNLCVNARDAIDGSGVITIRTRNEIVPEETARRREAAPGDHVCLSISDNGCGIPAEVIDKIFEPFFTTKETGKGTGLGLATSYGIVHQHGGWMECESTPGLGTTFHVFLPRNDKVETVEAAPAAAVIDGRGTETLLLVDDEAVVRIVAETVLKGHGYRLLTAADGQEAINVFRAHQDEISLVLMDMTMPRMSGLEAFRALRALDATVPVVICSGYVVDLCEFETPEGDRPNGFVQKPYHLQDLVTSVRSLIDATAAERSACRPPPPSPRAPALAG